VQEGENVEVGALLGEMSEGGAANDAKPEAKEEASTPAAAAPASSKDEEHKLSPAVNKMVNDNNLDASKIDGTGKDGRLTKEDVQNHMTGGEAKAAPTSAPAAPVAPRETGPREERVRMTRLRQAVAKRLKGAQETAAILTTFNEVDMTAIMDLRKQYQESFVKKHDVKLGFMSFFVKASIQALKEFPAVNAEIDGTDIVRAMVMPDGSIEARPMMYIALSYDHRIIDGKESVSFLVRVKEALEDPQRLLLDV